MSTTFTIKGCYCPYCGFVDRFSYDEECYLCHNPTELFTLKETLADEEFQKRYIFNDPRFNPELHQNYLEWSEESARVFNRGLQNSGSSIKCPTCSSYSTRKISGTSKVGKVALFGLFGAGDLGKTFKCKSCGYRW